VATEAAAPEVAEVPNSAPQPVQEEPEVVYGRHLLLSPAEVPLPRLLVKTQQALEETEAGFRREWEKLEAERLHLSNWERFLGDCIKTVSSRYSKEQLQEVLEQEATAAQRERVAVRREVMVIERELAMEERSKVALELTNHGKATLELIEEQRAALAEREAAVVKGEASLAVHPEELATRTQGL
jgi:hypothetical protein